MKQTLRGVLAFAAVLGLVASAPRPAAAMGPMAGTVRVAEMGRLVSPESCLACGRAADPAACHRTALSLAISHDWEKAIAIEENVHKARPTDAEIAAVLARMYQEGAHNTPRAVELYHEALGLSPGYPPALLGLGVMMVEVGDMGVAALYFRRGTRERPDEPQFKARLAEVLVKSGRDEEARPILNEIIARWPGSKEADAARRMMPNTALARP